MTGHTLDLRTSGFRLRSQALRLVSGPIAAIVVAALLTGLTVTWLVLRDDAAELASQAESEGTSAEQLRAALEDVTAEQGGTAAGLRAATVARSEALDAAAPAELDTFMILTAIHSLASADAAVHEIQIDATDSSLALGGQASSGDAAADYLERMLADLLWIDDAYIVRTSPAGDTGALEFRIEATVNELAHAPEPSFEATSPAAPPVEAPAVALPTASASVETTISTAPAATVDTAPTTESIDA